MRQSLFFVSSCTYLENNLKNIKLKTQSNKWLRYKKSEVKPAFLSE